MSMYLRRYFVFRKKDFTFAPAFIHDVCSMLAR
jgi:hypothetical protein